MFKAQVSRPDSNKHDWSERWDGWLPGWHTFKKGSQEQCDAVVEQYRAMGGVADTRVVPASKRDDED